CGGASASGVQHGRGRRGVSAGWVVVRGGPQGVPGPAGGKPVRVWDVFAYWRERWAVDARRQLWAELAPSVQYYPWALLGDRTHRGEHLLRQVTVPPAPTTFWTMTTLDAADDWGREAQQRDAIGGRMWQVDPDDLILL